MITKPWTVSDLITIRHEVTAQKPLIHCITNHISINDCANIVLAVGAKPIMAEHPLEVADITASAKALAVNLGNISDTRMTAMLTAGQAACRHTLPAIIDVVGIACSTLRLGFAKTFIQECHPAVIKGNLSELKALAGFKSTAKGIDAGEDDVLKDNNLSEIKDMLSTLAKKTNSVVVATGPTDIITDGQNTYLLTNGCEMLSLVTGTGCMLNVLIAAFMSSQKILAGAILGTALMGICGELSHKANGPASFRLNLLDMLYSIKDETLAEKIKYTLY